VEEVLKARAQTVSKQATFSKVSPSPSGGRLGAGGRGGRGPAGRGGRGPGRGPDARATVATSVVADTPSADATTDSRRNTNHDLDNRPLATRPLAAEPVPAPIPISATSSLSIAVTPELVADISPSDITSPSVRFTSPPPPAESQAQLQVNGSADLPLPSHTADPLPTQISSSLSDPLFGDRLHIALEDEDSLNKPVLPRVSGRKSGRRVSLAAPKSVMDILGLKDVDDITLTGREIYIYNTI
jgi:hypothetical protein